MLQKCRQLKIRVKGTTIRHTSCIKLRQNGTKSWTNTVQIVTVGEHTDVTSRCMDLKQQCIHHPL
jgi:hypothetical protein